jgi:hypothetical protein
VLFRSFLVAGDASEGELVWWAPVTMFVVGNAALLWLVRLSQGRLSVAQPMSLERETRPDAVLRFAPWLAVVGLSSLALLLAVDFRGVRLNLVDGLTQVPKDVRTRDDVKELRAKARRGEVPIDDYEQLVKSLK